MEQCEQWQLDQNAIRFIQLNWDTVSNGRKLEYKYSVFQKTSITTKISILMEQNKPSCRVSQFAEPGIEEICKSAEQCRIAEEEPES